MVFNCMNLRNKSLEILLGAYLVTATPLIASSDLLYAQQNTKQDSTGIQQTTGIKTKDNPILEYIADTLGNRDGKLDENEKNTLADLLLKNKKLYFFVRGPENSEPWAAWVKKEDKYLFSSPEDLKEHYKNDIRNIQQGILVINNNGIIIESYSCWNVIEWHKEQIPVLDYKKLMSERKGIK